MEAAFAFVPVTSAWYPILHNVYLYGGLTLFTLYIAYDTQKMIDEYEMGMDDHLRHAVDLFIDFKIIFTRVLWSSARDLVTTAARCSCALSCAARKRSVWLIA